MEKGSNLLKNRVVLVTGAGRGMGRGIALVLAKEGAAVVVGDIILDLAQKTAKIIQDQGGKSLPVLMDVTSLKDIESALNAAVKTFGKIDVLVNNAGVVNLEDVFKLTSQVFSRTMEVNVLGTFLCCQAFANKVKESNSTGNIINIASNAGKVGYAGQVDYNASKAAVINLTRVLALEFAPYQINVNAICPGAVETEMLLDCAKWITEKNGGDPVELMHTFAPAQLGRLIQPEEIGEVVAFLASEKAAIIRGQSINVDAGNTPY